MGKLKPNTFYVVQSWMVDELNLSGTELQVYAIIYGFSQDGKSKYEGSMSYLMAWTNTDRTTIYRTLIKLVKNGLIIKSEPKTIKGIKKSDYYANLEVVNRCCKTQHGMLQNATSDVANCNEVCCKTQHNNINKKNNKKDSYMPETKNSFNRIETHMYDYDEYEKNVVDN